MADLTQYHNRRDFERTAEPRGATKPGRSREREPASYVIQKHAARNLHYDFRLELEGVLLSWAVPKGPSLDPSVRRLAVEVEPHPVEYGDFEGEISQGQYGAGSVIVWDKGDWEPLDEDPKAAYARGHLTFTLNGHKLHGTWHLVRTRGSKDQKQWLLFKSRDEYAEAGENTILERAPNSVVSGRSIEEIAQRVPAKRAAKQSAVRKPRSRTRTTAPSTVDPPSAEGTLETNVAVAPIANVEHATKKRLPQKIDVQLAQLTREAPGGSEWLHEIKYDGYRVVVRIAHAQVQLLTRKALDWTAKMPALASAFAALRLDDAIIDGEFVALDESGVSHFQALQNSLSSNEHANLVYYAFDLLYYAGFDLSAVPLVERKALLKHVLTEKLRGQPESVISRIRYSEHVTGTGPAFFAQACKLGLEGIVSKRAHGTHVGGRSNDWLKIKCTQRQEFVVVGYTDPAGSRSNFGALLVAVNEDSRLVYAGRVGTGFTARSLNELHAKLLALHTSKVELLNAPKGAQARGVHWVTPTLVAQVAFTGFTEDGVLRHPAFEGLREDKQASEVRREDKAVHSKLPTRRTIRATDPVDTSKVKLTNPNKVLYPEQGITKQQLLDYAAMVAPFLLPHVVNRPLTLVRCPNGASKHCFFQKHPGEAKIPGLHAVGIREKEGKADYTVIRDAEGLFALVQLGVLEIHTSGALASDFEHPNMLVFDLDPDPEVQFSAVMDCARRLREIFAGAELESFVKTTGGKGLHVCIPIDPVLHWDEAKAFTQRVAQALVKESPHLYVATQSKAQRKGKIYVDYLRNARGATFVAPYSTRARGTAPVATPLFWEELKPDLKPDQFTVENLARRLAELDADPFERMPTLLQRLPQGPTKG